MSLVGNLEDLGLGEILQIVSLSRKSGILALHSKGREGRVVFRQGQVIRATSTTYQESLGDVLARCGRPFSSRKGRGSRSGLGRS